MELSEGLYSECPLQEPSVQSGPGRKKSLLPVAKTTVHCPVHSKRYRVRSDNSHVKALAGVPTDTEPNQYSDLKLVSGSLPMLPSRFSKSARFTWGAEG